MESPATQISKDPKEGNDSAISPPRSTSSSDSPPSSSSDLFESPNNENHQFGDSSGKSKCDGNLSPVPEHQGRNSSPSSSLEIGTSAGPVDEGKPTGEHPEGYDPNRIPASVFSKRPADSSDWSMNSNESLFSIRMSSTSFSGENSLFGIGKSADLSWLDDCSTSHNSVSEPPKCLSPLIEDSSAESGTSSQDSNSSVKIVKGMKNVENQKMTRDEVTEPESAETTPISSRLSNGSGHSNYSFAFPVLANDVGKSSSINWIPEKKPSVKPELVEQPPPSQPTPNATTSKASSKKRFCDFSRWRRCCCC